MKYLLIFALVFMCVNGYACDNAERKIERIKEIICKHNCSNEIWERGVNLNVLLGENPCFRPDYGKKWEYCLAVSEYCPYCGAFSYWHRQDKKSNRKCIRCGAEWECNHTGNYWATQSLMGWK